MMYYVEMNYADARLVLCGAYDARGASDVASRDGALAKRARSGCASDVVSRRRCWGCAY